MKKLVLTDEQADKLKEVIETYEHGYTFAELRIIDKFLTTIEMHNIEGTYQVDDAWVDLIKTVFDNTKWKGDGEARRIIFSIAEALELCH